MICKTLHRKLKITRIPLNIGVNSGAPKEKTVAVPDVDPLVTLLYHLFICISLYF
jgi:hypothetical protein